ncbi:hypothetical protein GCM10011344_44510 [Dokdonia pacifica]|uniref:Uncharacterized protein n=1 Tax=Dokdonia pacifica TaxID=1627892 RepID=A0A239CMS3_9FLAO|nr:hypothetical protein [Dokdonia pacifica]GGG38692.1 hypothetical protein GCM10011344_44510 [Dokdonia pacifica]SNS21162.1 hypothetical protein SAMN06265376_10881 [Dokdonia pacifica]
MNLSEIVKNPYYLKDREELFNYQLFYEIKKTGLENKIDFELLEPIIDKNGYDLLIKYRNHSKAIQLKSAERNGTSSWKINKKFFKPITLLEASTIIPNSNASHIGLGGGIILIEYFITVENKVEIKYYYTDFVCISFFLRKRKEWPLQKSLPEFIKDIYEEGNGKHKFSIPKSLFFEVNIEQMLYLARILPVTDSLKNPGSWFFNYPKIDEIIDCDRPVKKFKTKKMLESGESISFNLEVYDIFNCNYVHSEISINGKMKI